ncbi:hypothetical protein AB0F25_30550 [Streptomyces wedmorensis]|uniref:hypothetical protein n=1 Tax=Streptomyces wedmorensis TaxID=43759 RepID=UPI00342C27BD
MVIAPKTWVGRLAKLEPLAVRGSVVAILGVVGMIFNIQFADGFVENVISLVLAALSLLTVLVARPAVTPNVKVQQMLPQPFKNDRTVYGEDQI